MTTDAPEELSPAELDDMRATLESGAHLGSLAKRRMIARLLANIDALEAERAPAAVDREALGRKAWTVAPSILFSDRWDDLQPHERERLCRIGDHLYQMGHALGAASRDTEVSNLIESINAAHSSIAEKEAEVDALRVQFLDAIQDRDEAQREAEEAEQEKRAMAAHLTAARTDNERLTAELADKRKECSSIHADLARSRELYPIVKAELDDLRAYQAERIAAARAEGAREEREACAEIAEQCSGGDATISKRDLIASRIRARGQAT